MGGISHRISRLEDLSRDGAVGELRRVWASFTDEEVAMVLVPYAEWVQAGEPTPEEKEVREKARAAMPEELIAAAIGLTERMEPEEVDRRIGTLFPACGLPERGESIRRHMRAAREGRR